ncbi:MAG TPA: hypothetical protein ENI96_12515 [Sedimenticola thiotaurini]|uniref:Glycosyltransferase n=1 Tax=Sedimenticola thiotaurini TaxID=1543721 RepID=A0A831W851_9GAMM|nr:hypothetical protein [Sedimenticola thiotaurini]
MKNFLCMKWGDLYGPEYVNNLYASIARNVTPPFRLTCLTDDPAGIRDEVACFDCPTVDAPPPYDNTGWRKLVVWDEQVADLEGDVLFLDLDVVIVGDLDPFFEFGEGFCVARNWTQMKAKVGNTSVFRFTVGQATHLYRNFMADAQPILDRYDNEQIYVSREIERMTFWPDAWCKSFKVHCIPPMPLRWFMEPRIPEGARVIAFTGTPNPPDAARGEWPLKPGAPAYKKIYKHVRPTSWIAEYWK